MDGLCLHTGSLRHSLGGSACRSGKENAKSCRLPCRNDTLGGCGLSCTRTACQYHYLAFCCHVDGSLLHIIIGNARFLLDGFHIHLTSEKVILLGIPEFQEFFSHTHFRVIEGWEIDALVLHFEFFC